MLPKSVYAETGKGGDGGVDDWTVPAQSWQTVIPADARLARKLLESICLVRAKTVAGGTMSPLETTRAWESPDSWLCRRGATRAVVQAVRKSVSGKEEGFDMAVLRTSFGDHQAC